MDNAKSDLIGGRGQIARLFVGVDSHNPFGTTVNDQDPQTETPYDDPRRRELVSDMPQPADPDGLRAPGDQTTTPTANWTLDVQFADGSNLYDGELQPRTRDAGEVFSAERAAELHALVQAGSSPPAVKPYARTGGPKIAPTDLQTKLEEIANSFDGEGWKAAGGVTALRAAIYTASDIAGQNFANSRIQGLHVNNYFVGIRIPLDSKDLLDDFRVYIGDSEDGYHTLYPASAWTHLADDAEYAYYTQQIADHPAADHFGVQERDPVRLDREAGTATVDTILQDGPGIRQTVTETSLTLRGVSLAPESGNALDDTLRPGEQYRLEAAQNNHPAARLFAWNAADEHGDQGIALTDSNGMKLVAFEDDYSGLGASAVRGRLTVRVPSAQLSNRPQTIDLYPSGGELANYTVAAAAVPGISTGTASFYLVQDTVTFSGLDFSREYRINLRRGNTATYRETLAAGLYRRGGIGEAAWIALPAAQSFAVPALYVIGLTEPSGGTAYAEGPPLVNPVNGVNRKFVQPQNAMVVQNDWSTVDLIANANAVMGITVNAANEIVFAQARRVTLTGSMESTLDGSGGAARLYQFFRLSKVGSPNTVEHQTVCSSYSKVTHPDSSVQAALTQGPRHEDTHISMDIDADAGDRYVLEWKSYIQTGGQTDLVPGMSGLRMRIWA